LADSSTSTPEQHDRRGYTPHALGQLADYSRFITPTPRLGVLLPSRPRPDLEALLATQSVAAIWVDGEAFVDNAEGNFVQFKRCVGRCKNLRWRRFRWRGFEQAHSRAQREPLRGPSCTLWCKSAIGYTVRMRPSQVKHEDRRSENVRSLRLRVSRPYAKGRERSSPHRSHRCLIHWLWLCYIEGKGADVARKTIRVSDMSGEEIPEGRGATVRITFADARRGARELDVTDAEAEKFGGRVVARRGRKPKSV
jgi:hypothetical protein